MSVLERKVRVQCIQRCENVDSRFTPKTAREVIGNKFPITGAKGETKGEGRVVEAECQDDGFFMALTIEVPAHLAPNLELDAGVSMGEPYPSRPRPAVG